MSAAHAEAEADALFVAFTKAWSTGDLADWRAIVKKHRDLSIPLAVMDALCVRPIIAINDRNRERQLEIDALKERCQALEERPRGLKYCGTWSASDGPYVVGDVTTDKGSMWVCTKQTKLRPGETPDWQLAVKAGRDATR